METDKLKFLTETFIQKLETIPASEPPRWGLMNVQQMIEHMSDSIRIANGKQPHILVTPEDKLPQFRSFMLSDKEFKPNTKNILLPDVPAALIHPSKEAAIAELKTEINDFINHFKHDSQKVEMNPFFGTLSFEEWLHLFHKHGIHHLKQFGVELNITNGG